MLQVTLFLHTMDRRHNKVPENRQWRKPILYLAPIPQFCADELFSHLMLHVILCENWQHWRQKWKIADMQRRKPFSHLPPIHQLCVYALFSHLMLQVMFCGVSEQWCHNWRTADMQRRKPFPLLSPYHQLIVQCNKYILFVGNLILTSNQMYVILMCSIRNICLLQMS